MEPEVQSMFQREGKTKDSRIKCVCTYICTYISVSLCEDVNIAISVSLCEDVNIGT